MGDTVPRRRGRLALGALLGLLLATGFAGDLPAAEAHLAGSCDITKMLGYCMEYRGADWTPQDARDDCGTAPDGVFRGSPCPSAKRVGICSYLPRGTEDSRILYIFYAPMDVSAARMSCPGTFTPAK
jgi:hypothetical protein